MNYKEAFEWLKSLEKFGSVLGLDTIQELMRRLQNPQNQIPMIHVAGTNGKGSIITYLEYVLESAGYRVGKYISPSVVHYWEKIQINGVMIEEKEVAYYVEQIKNVCEEMVQDGLVQPTLFECETALAFLYFAKSGCDIALIETGMGGLTDATNVIKKPVCEVIASVSMDHMGVLGNTLEEIAECKAGIIMPETDVVCYGGNREVIEVIQRKASEEKARLLVSDFSQIQNVKVNGFKQYFSYKHHTNMEIALAGEHQLKNAATALEVIDVLNAKGFDLSEDIVKKGMQLAKWPGRFECISSKPVIVLDGAHNMDAAEQLKAAIQMYLAGKTIIFVMGVFRDKEYEKIIRLTNSLASEIITINSDNKRSIPSEELSDIVKEICTVNKAVYAANSPIDGIKMATARALELGDDKTAIVVFGSLSFLGEIRQYVKAKGNTEV